MIVTLTVGVVKNLPYHHSGLALWARLASGASESLQRKIYH